MGKCSVDGCCDKARKRGWCEFHYERWRKHGDPLLGGPRRNPPNSQGECSVVGCENKAVARHLCNKHFFKLQKHGDANGGYEIDGRSKEWHVNNLGYVMRFDPKSPHAGKNRIVYQLENLELWVTSQPSGQKPEDLVKWAYEIIELYGEEVKPKLKLVNQNRRQKI